MSSKKHLKAAQRGGHGDDQEEQLARVVWADAVQRTDEDGETHAERRVRLLEVWNCKMMFPHWFARKFTLPISAGTAARTTDSL